MDFKCDELIFGKKDADSRALTDWRVHVVAPAAMRGCRQGKETLMSTILLITIAVQSCVNLRLKPAFA